MTLPDAVYEELARIIEVEAERRAREQANAESRAAS